MDQIDVNQLVRSLNKTLQAFRIRLKIMEGRKKWVDEVLSKGDKIYGIDASYFNNSDNPSSYFDEQKKAEIRSLLRNEKRLLKIIRAEESGGENLIIRALGYLKSAFSIFQSKKRKEINQQLRRYG